MDANKNTLAMINKNKTFRPKKINHIINADHLPQEGHQFAEHAVVVTIVQRIFAIIIESIGL